MAKKNIKINEQPNETKIRYYVRVSTVEQSVCRQLCAYDKADLIYVDRMSGKNRNRPELQRMLNDLQEGDTVVVKSLHRISRSTKDMLEIVEEINEKGAYLQVLELNLDTSTAIGQFVLTILAAVAELERKTIRQRTIEGIAIAKSKGKYKGRKPGSIKLKGTALKQFIKDYSYGLPKSRLAEMYGVPKSTLYRWIKILRERGEIKSCRSNAAKAYAPLPRGKSGQSPDTSI